MQVIAMGRWSKAMKRWAMVVPMRRPKKDAAAKRPTATKQPRES